MLMAEQFVGSVIFFFFGINKTVQILLVLLLLLFLHKGCICLTPQNLQLLVLHVLSLTHYNLL